MICARWVALANRLFLYRVEYLKSSLDYKTCDFVYSSMKVWKQLRLVDWFIYFEHIVQSNFDTIHSIFLFSVAT